MTDNHPETPNKELQSYYFEENIMYFPRVDETNFFHRVILPKINGNDHRISKFGDLGKISTFPTLGG